MSGIRILGGEARGRVLRSLGEGDLSVRPMLSRMKKSLFDILCPKLAGAAFLDLYAGTGAVGIEALSRGCRHVIFVEMSPRSINVIKQNLAMLGWEKRAEIVRMDVTRGLTGLPGPFDIIFLGPPYKDEQKRMLALTSPTLKAIYDAHILAADGVIIGQHHIKEPVAVPPGLTLFRREKYGDTIISFLKYVK